MKTYTFHVHGMHCKACEVLTEMELKEDPRVTSVRSSLMKHPVEIAGNFGDSQIEDIAKELSGLLSEHSLSTERQEHDAKWAEFRWALPIAFGFIASFIFLQKIGVVNLVTSSEVSYGTAFVIGIIASLSTCMAVVGGLVLSMSANFAKEGDKLRPQILFHIGRLVSFFILGGVIGALGATFQLGQNATFILNLIIALVLLILGINLLNIFPWAKKFQITMPSFIGKHIHGLKSLNHNLTPLLVGVATFFLPCGFTQSMQIYTLTTGSFASGALIMGAFALGTLPVLALLSFTSLAIRKKAQSSIFFKTAGLVVIFFALFNLLNALVAVGLIPPLFSF